jgi:hypothetical protein
MENHNLRNFFYALAGILGLVFIGLLGWFVLDLKSLYQTGALRPAISKHGNNHIQSPVQIQDWMTFRYINRVFGLPENYLYAKLNITSPYYPNLVLGTYAVSHKLNSVQFLISVKQAVEGYPLGVSQ